MPGFSGSTLGTVVPGTWPSAHRTCPQTLAAVLTALPRSSSAELTISALSLALLVPVKELNVRFRDRLPTPIPGEIVMVRMTPGSPPLHCTDPAHPVGTGHCRPLVECREVTAKRSCLQVYLLGLLPEHFDPPESAPPTHIPSRASSRPLRMPSSSLRISLAVSLVSTPGHSL